MFTIIGTLTSFFGIGITFIQIIAIREISILTQQTISETKEKLILGISISDVTEAIAIIGEIDNFIGIKKFEIARIKLIELKSKLLQFKSNQEFQNIIHENKIKKVIDQLSVYINDLYLIMNVDNGNEVDFDSAPMNAQLQDIHTYLNSFRNTIKYQTV